MSWMSQFYFSRCPEKPVSTGVSRRKSRLADTYDAGRGGLKRDQAACGLRSDFNRASRAILPTSAAFSIPDASIVILNGLNDSGEVVALYDAATATYRCAILNRRNEAITEPIAPLFRNCPFDTPPSSADNPCASGVPSRFPNRRQRNSHS
jgi:hypothetical protein